MPFQVNNNSLRRWGGYLYLCPYLVLFAAFVVYPFFYGLGLSLLQWELLSGAPAKFVGLQNYQEAVNDPYFWKALWATVRFVVMITPLTVVGALLLALGLHAIKGPRQGFYRTLYFIPTLISITVVGILWRWFYTSEFGLFAALLQKIHLSIPFISDSRLAMKSIVVMTLWWTIGGPMVILLAGLQQIPPQYFEAAEIDGAGSLAKFRHVTLPQLRPVLLFVFVMNLIGSFQVFGQTFIVTWGGPELSTRVLVQYIYETAFQRYRMGYGAAMSWLLFVIVLVMSVAQFRLMREK